MEHGKNAWTLGVFACRRSTLVAQKFSLVRGNETSFDNQKYGNLGRRNFPNWIACKSSLCNAGAYP